MLTRFKFRIAIMRAWVGHVATFAEKTPSDDPIVVHQTILLQPAAHILGLRMPINSAFQTARRTLLVSGFADDWLMRIGMQMMDQTREKSPDMNQPRMHPFIPKAAPTHRVLVLDRDPMSSHLLASTLTRDPRFDARVVTPSELMAGIQASETNLLVISEDSLTKPRRGVELAFKVHRTRPDVAIVILVDSPGRDSVISAFRAGARAVFSRRQTMAEFLECIEMVSLGRIWAGRTETGFLLEALKTIPAPSNTLTIASAPLTARESEVIQRAARGKTNKRIALDLGLSEHTVKNYLCRAFEKLGVSSRVELLFYLTTSGHDLDANLDQSADRQSRKGKETAAPPNLGSD
jgi:two-component system, NarL family, nitrate/nitrite response regulator NarL